jgi:hypothetical protein
MNDSVTDSFVVLGYYMDCKLSSRTIEAVAHELIKIRLPNAEQSDH